MQTRRNFSTRIGIAEQSRRQLIELLSARLADAFDLYSRLKHVHWTSGLWFVEAHLQP